MPTIRHLQLWNPLHQCQSGQPHRWIQRRPLQKVRGSDRLSRGGRCDRGAAPKHYSMTLKASMHPARWLLDTLFTATIEACWYHTLASTMPTWTQKLNTSAASSSLTTARYTGKRFKEKKQTPKCHCRGTVAFRWVFGRLFLFYFLMLPWSSSVIFSSFFALLQHAIVLQYYSHKLLLGLVGETQSLTWLGAKPILRGTQRDQVRCLMALAGYRRFERWALERGSKLLTLPFFGTPLELTFTFSQSSSLYTSTVFRKRMWL